MQFRGQHGRYRALVVDDDRTCRELACGALVNNDFLVDQACSGGEAILACKTMEYDIIFMDIEMPNIDGYETVKAIRKLKQGSRNAYIMALTGNANTTEEVLRCLMREKLWKWLQKKEL